MLSIFDLIKSQTLSPELAAYLILALWRGASLLVGARPGGAGKTAVMGALLGMLPPGELIFRIENDYTVNNLKTRSKKSWKDKTNRTRFRKFTLVCPEIGKGSLYGYLWGPVVKDYFKLVDDDIRIISNLHADNLKEILDQLESSGVSIFELTRINILIFLRVSFGVGDRLKRKVVSVLEAQKTKKGDWEYKEVFDFNESGEIYMKNKSVLVPLNEDYEKTLRFINRIKRIKESTIEAVRNQFLSFVDLELHNKGITSLSEKNCK
jgi:hypothetical protein